MQVLACAAGAVTLLAVVTAAYAGSKHQAKTAVGALQRGGVYRTAVSTFGLTDNFDPTGETQIGFAYAVYDATSRNLVAFRHIPGAAGSVPVADLATSVPKPTDGGRTYTFHLKPGIKFGPPVNRAITSQDIEYAFQRINDATLVPQYGYYYDGLIKGLTGKAKTPDSRISGISTPNATTIVFHLTRAAGDFLQRIACRPRHRSRKRWRNASSSRATTAATWSRPARTCSQGADAVDICSVLLDQGDRGLRPDASDHARPQPQLSVSPPTRPARTALDGVSISIDPERLRHLRRASPRASSTGR